MNNKIENKDKCSELKKYLKRDKVLKPIIEEEYYKYKYKNEKINNENEIDFHDGNYYKYNLNL